MSVIPRTRTYRWLAEVHCRVGETQWETKTLQIDACNLGAAYKEAEPHGWVTSIEQTSAPVD